MLRGHYGARGMLIPFRSTLFAAGMLGVMAISTGAFGEEYPTNVRRVACPETGHALLESSPQYYTQRLGWILDRGPKHYVSRCYYDNGAAMLVYWSNDLANKDAMCNAEYYRGKFLGDRYNTVDLTPPTMERFGLQYQQLPEEGYAIVRGVTRNSPAERAGIKLNDQVLAVDGMEISTFSVEDLQKFLAAKHKVTLKVHDTEQFIYRDVTLTKAQVRMDQRMYELYSPVHFAMVTFDYPDVAANEQADYAFWRKKAQELLQSVEDKGVVCLDLDVTNRGPVAD